MAQVVTFADQSCRECRGNGYLVPGKDCPPVGTGAQQPKACTCAMQAFLRKHRTDVDFLSNCQVWLLGRCPPELQRLAAA
jgi:hypothetical protein